VLRGTVVYAQSEELALADAPIGDDVCGGGSDSAVAAWIELDGYYADLKAGRWVIVSGERADLSIVDPVTNQSIPVSGVQGGELVMLSNVVQAVASPAGRPLTMLAEKTAPLPDEVLHTFVQFSRSLAFCYKRATVAIHGNVVKATHGETQNEVLGNGDGSKPLQSFTLKKPPLTFVAAPTAEGAASTLQAYVNNVGWKEAGSLAELGPRDRGFVTLGDDAGNTTLIFGDGQHGARVPTGIVNVRAVYRCGIGSAGNVAAGQVTQLQTRPVGVKAVLNPLPASGGADKESRDLARENTPLSVMSLDRLVSVQDYADFTRRFAGIGKAVAQRSSDGRRQVVCLTIAGVDDAPIDITSDLYRNLVEALTDLGDADLPLRIDLRELKMLVLAARIRIAGDHVWDDVAVAVRSRLLEVFGFRRRALGQGVRVSEVLSAIQGVDGVDYVDIDTLGAISEIADGTAPRRPRTPAEVLQAVQQLLGVDGGDALPADVAAWPGGSDLGVLRPAELVMFSPAIPDTLVLNQIP
jgi:predicted phage baseplate assembly protein